MEKLLISTTPILQDIEIKKYIGPLTANVVLGVNFFSDFAASLTDVFGGNSETYQSKLNILTDEVTKLIKSKANSKGANAIIDYKLQFNEISGKGKQMFMVTATGTACVIEMPEQEESIKVNGNASYAQIQKQFLTVLFRWRLSNKEKLTNEDWDNIISLNITELCNELVKEYFRLNLIPSMGQDYDFPIYKDSYIAKFEEYISRIDKSNASECIYQYLDSNPEQVAELVIKYNLFEPKAVVAQIKSNNISVAVDLLRSHKDYYTTEDLEEMNQIVYLLNNLENRGSLQMSKSGLFSKKEEEMYLCPNGHKNPKENVHCSNCGLNIKGLTLEQVNIIDRFKHFTSALASLLK